jgi:uncharacterized protein (TIGR03435 family)
MTATPSFGFSCPLISGSIPAWVKTDRLEIQAKMPANSVPAYTARQLRFEETPELNAMLQVLLEDRFHLNVHWETRELPVYVLTVGKSGPMFKKTPPGGEVMKVADGSSIEVHGASGIRTTHTLDDSLRTKLVDFTIEYDDDPNARTALNVFSGLTPSALSMALWTLGLKLEAAKAPLEVLIIDHVEKSAAN